MWRSWGIAMKILSCFLSFFIFLNMQTTAFAGLDPSNSLSSKSVATISWDKLSDTDISGKGKLAFTFKPETWKHTETEHFVYHFMDEKKASMAWIHSEAFYSWIKDFLGSPETPGVKKSHIFLFEDKTTWTAFRRKAKPVLFEAVGFTDGKELFMYIDPFWLSPKKVLAHELTHIILLQFLKGTIPLSLNEGLAEFVGYRMLAVAYEGDEYTIRTVQLVPKSSFIDTEKLLSYKNYPKNEIATYYDESQLLVRFLVTTYGGDRFYKLLVELSHGSPMKETFEKIYETSFEKLSSDFKATAIQPD